VVQGKWSLRLKGGVKEAEPNLGKYDWWVGKRPFSIPHCCFSLYEKLNRERYGPFNDYGVGCHWRENRIARMVAACSVEMLVLTYKTTTCHDPEGQNLNNSRFKPLKTTPFLPDKLGDTMQETRHYYRESNLNAPDFVCMK
jgi:hypothetical protein